MTDAAPVLDREAQRPDFFDRVRRRLSLDVPAALRDLTAPAERGDLDLDPETWAKAGVRAARPAAVLIPVVERAVQTGVFAQPSARLTTHTGQFAFPSGHF